jgi:cytoskeletal protein CcmA (bactofilin family)
MRPSSGILPKVVLSLLLAVILVSCRSWNPSHDRTMRRVVVPAGEVHEGWLFGAGDQVIIEGTVNGDAYVAGGIVEVDGTINGDLIAAGGQVNISGTVSDNVRAVGGNIQVNGTVGKNVSTAAGSIAIGRSAAVGGGILAASGNLTVSGTVARDARVAAGNMSVSGKIDGNVDFAGDNISVLQGSKIGGNLTARLKQKENADIAQGAVVGTVEVTTYEARPVHQILGLGAFRFWAKIVWALSLLLVGLVLTIVFPKQFRDLGLTIDRLAGMSFLWGIVGLIVIPIAGLILMMTLIGIPLGLLVWTLYLWMLYFTQLTLGVFLGHRLFGIEEKKGGNLFWAFTVGLIIVQALTFIPYVRFLVVLAGLIFGMGAILLVLKGEFEARRTA